MKLQTTYTDSLGNQDTITIIGDKIRMGNQHRIAESLANIQHLFTDAFPEIHREGTAGTRSIIAQAIREAAKAAHNAKRNHDKAFTDALNSIIGSKRFEAGDTRPPKGA